MSYHNLVMLDGLLAPERFYESCVGRGWWPLVRKLCGDIDTTLEGSGAICVVSQVKEKFGGLRFYFGVEGGGAATEGVMYANVEKLVDKAEQKSCEVCEECGEQGEPTNERGWIKTLCEKCRDERGETS